MSVDIHFIWQCLHGPVFPELARMAQALHVFIAMFNVAVPIVNAFA